MKNVLFLVLLFSGSTLLLSGCLFFSGETVEYSGFVKDVSTGKNLTGYVMEFETYEEKEKAEVDRNGKFKFSISVGSDYIVYVNKAGYKPFQCSHVADSKSSQDQRVNEEMELMYNVPLIPDTIASPAITVRVVDGADGTRINSGSYRVVASSTALGYNSTIYDDGAGTGHPYWIPDTQPFAGTLQQGEFIIPENTLLPFISYSIAVFGVSGYRDIIMSLPTATESTNTTPFFNIEMSKYASPGIPKLLAQSHVGPDGVTPIVLPARTITFIFDRNIEVKKTGLKQKGIDQLIAVATPVDSDNDGLTTSTTILSETIPPTDYSIWVQVNSSGNVLTISIPERDNFIIPGYIDYEDELKYSLTDALLSNVLVQDPASQGAYNWTPLKSYDGESANKGILGKVIPTLLIRKGTP